MKVKNDHRSKFFQFKALIFFQASSFQLLKLEKFTAMIILHFHTFLCHGLKKEVYIHVHHWFSFLSGTNEDHSEADISKMTHEQNNQSPALLGFQTFTTPISPPTSLRLSNYLQWRQFNDCRYQAF